MRIAKKERARHAPRAFATAILTAIATLAAIRPAAAADVNETARTLATQVLRSDLSSGWARERAHERLAFAEGICAEQCRPKVRARLALARGVLHAQEGRDDEAVAAFRRARTSDPEIALPPGRTGGPAADAFAKATAPEASTGEEAATDEAKETETDPPVDAAGAGTGAAGDTEKSADETETLRDRPPSDATEAAATADPEEPADETEPDETEPDEPPDAELPVDVLFGLEVAGYADDNDVAVLTPGLSVAVEDPIGGWGVGGSFMVDVVSAASPDILTSASPRWEDVRYAPAIDGHVGIGDWDLSANASYSTESDFRSIGAGVGASVDLAHKQVTPSLSYSFGHDTGGRRGTDFDVYSLVLMRHGVLADVTLVLDAATILVPGLTYVFETGRQEKPYRYLPVFAPNVDLEPGTSIDRVNTVRLPPRMEESLPRSRHRGALSLLLARRFVDVTLRITERLYTDNWGLMATTTDVRVPWDLADGVRLWPHLRVHAQTGVDFWKLGYRAEPTGAAPLALPRYRTGDRELGPLVGVTGGLGLRFALGDVTALSVSGDAIYHRFLEHLYRESRLAGFVVTLLEVELR